MISLLLLLMGMVNHITHRISSLYGELEFGSFILLFFFFHGWYFIGFCGGSYSLVFRLASPASFLLFSPGSLSGSDTSGIEGRPDAAWSWPLWISDVQKRGKSGEVTDIICCWGYVGERWGWCGDNEF